jgi:sucrose synthase
MSLLPMRDAKGEAATRPAQVISAEHIPAVKHFFMHLRAQEQSFFLADEIEEKLDEWLEVAADAGQDAATAIRRMFRGSQEVITWGDYAYAVLRPKVGVKRIVRLHPEGAQFEEVSRFEYLKVKEAYVHPQRDVEAPSLLINFAPYFSGFPKVREPSEMGEGIRFLNRNLAGHMYTHPTSFRRALLEFLVSCSLDSTNLLVNDYISSPEMLSDALDEVRRILDEHEDDAPYKEIAHDLRVHGFEPGWGATVGKVRERLAMLSRLLEAPDPDRFEQLLSQLPLVRTILMVSPHGWFAQDDVLGKPDTGGQVVYVLDQARALERRMHEHLQDCGLDIMPKVIILTRLIPESEGTTCNQPRERVQGSENTYIVRVPFIDKHDTVIPHWISRFHIWPYLESFARRARHTVVSELGARPDLIIGHYSDGNLVAHLLAEDLGTTHCAAVHALEKTKYLFSDMNWEAMENDYRFSMQYTADLLAYNSADFIITSSYREIGGSSTEMGMFESYETFTMPGLYRVISGMDPQLARYNIVPPGALPEYFFPYQESGRRVEGATRKLKDLLYSAEPGEGCSGRLDNPDLPAVFSMARVDKLKNLSGLVRMYGESEELRRSSNLILLSSIMDPAVSDDFEEREELELLHRLVAEYKLEGHFRWVARRLNKVETGEVYRVVADQKGVFAQPALMETFGLTIIESMACGLPIVVTCFGGPAEIVIPGECGEIHNPNHSEAFADALARIVTDGSLWEKYSQGGIVRAREPYNWEMHTTKLLRLSNIYSYWNYLDVMNRQALDQYIHTLYFTVYRERAQQLLMER